MKNSSYKLINHHEEVYGNNKPIPYSILMEETEKKLFKINDVNNWWIEDPGKQNISKYIHYVLSYEMDECLEISYLTRKQWLIDSISEIGIVTPLFLGILNPLDSSKRNYCVLDGRHRVSIAKLLGIREVPALLYEIIQEDYHELCF